MRKGTKAATAIQGGKGNEGTRALYPQHPTNKQDRKNLPVKYNEKKKHYITQYEIRAWPKNQPPHLLIGEHAKIFHPHRKGGKVRIFKDFFCNEKVHSSIRYTSKRKPKSIECQNFGTKKKRRRRRPRCKGATTKEMASILPTVMQEAYAQIRM